MKNRKGGLLAVTLTAVLLFVYYSRDIMCAGQLRYGAWGDGYKNFYTLAYYLKNDSGAHFSGMNYPFGENVLFTDNQPAVAWMLKAVTFIFPAFADHVYVFLVLVFFASLLFSALIIYKILRQFEVGEVHAALFSSLIVLLCPQMQRLGGHFSLSYTFYIPAMIYLLIRFFKTDGRLKYFWALLLLNSAFIFIHIYYAAMSGMFVLMAAGTYKWSKRNDFKKSLRPAFLLAVVSLAPFVLLKSFLLITDKLNDRPKAPWGFIENRSTVYDIILHPFSFTGEFLGQVFPNAGINYHFEGEGYVGLITILTLVGITVFYLIFRKKRSPFFADLYPFNLLILPALVVLAFALAFPFCIHPLEKYYVKMPAIIKQFRASGRFNWYFYYTSTILSAIFLYRLFNMLLLRNKAVAYSTMAVVYTVWFIEANMVSNHQALDFRNNSIVADQKVEKDELLNAIHQSGKQISDFQALLPLAIFLNGSEKLYIESSVSFDAMKASLFTGLPIIGTQMSRTSQSQTFQIADLLSDPLMKKNAAGLFKCNKPLLVITHGEDLSKQERALLSKAKFLFKTKDNTYLQLDISAFKDSVNEAKEHFRMTRSKFFQHDEYLSTDSCNNVVVKRFENEFKDYAVFGKGAHYSEKDPTYFYFDTLPGAKDSVPYEISYWVYTDSRRAAYPAVYITQLDAGAKEINKFDTNAKFATNIFNNWVRVSMSFTLTNKANKILILGEGNYSTFDEIMIRPLNVEVVTQVDNDSTFIFNNYPIR